VTEKDAFKLWRRHLEAADLDQLLRSFVSRNPRVRLIILLSDDVNKRTFFRSTMYQSFDLLSQVAMSPV